MAKRTLKKDASRTRLDQHQRQGKRLSPPFNRLGNVAHSSWVNDRLPNVLWACLLVGGLDRDLALNIFRQIADNAHQLGKNKLPGIEHGYLAKLSKDDFDYLLRPALQDEKSLSAMRPLGFFETLPDLEHWKRHLQAAAPETDGQLLASAIAKAFDHQSQESTDCRWLRVLVKMAIGQMVFVGEMQKHAREFIGYPNVGDQRAVRPSIRAAEIGFNNLEEGFESWADAFWSESWRKTDCIPLSGERYRDARLPKLDADLMGIYVDVGEYAQSKEAGTSVDARFDSVFGLVLYAIAISAPIMKTGSHARAEGRIALRCLVESYITLAYLLHVDNDQTWRKYRTYGTGQAKLAFLKIDELEEDDLPSYISRDDLARYVNEDIWEEFTDIDLGHWAGTDLRKMSETSGTKAIYDKYYTWPSIYVHSSWPAVREVVFDQCLNPLHRFHRITAPPNYNLDSVAGDIIKLVNLHLELLNRAYPSFKRRVKAKDVEAEKPDQE